MFEHQILIIGGYGAVGGHLAACLAPRFPGAVVVAGRDGARARAFAAALGHGTRGIVVDLEAPEPLVAVQAGDVVVTCVDERVPRLARHVLAAGAVYVDITADLNQLRTVERLDALACGAGASAVMSVGLAPGVTNLLAGQLVRRFDEPVQLNMTLVLSGAEAHGRAAVDWTIDHLDEPFAATRGGEPWPTRPFSHRTHVTQAEGSGTAFRFGFPEQRTLADTLGVPNVSSWLAIDPPAVGWGAAFVARAGAGRLLRTSVGRALTRAACDAVVGPAPMPWRVVVDGAGLVEGVLRHHRLSATGTGQSTATALVAAATVQAVVAGRVGPGVHHIEQLTVADGLLRELTAGGIRIDGLAAGGDEPRRATAVIAA